MRTLAVCDSDFGLTLESNKLKICAAISASKRKQSIVIVNLPTVKDIMYALWRNEIIQLWPREQGGYAAEVFTTVKTFYLRLTDGDIRGPVSAYAAAYDS
jgi:hypothetical protein